MNAEVQPKSVKQTPPSYKVPNWIEGVYEVVESVAQAVVVAILLLSVFFRISIVDGESMLPTLQDRDTLIISNFLYEPKQGDIVVVQPMTQQMQKLIIKRVIATEGQVVDIDPATWTVTVDGEPIATPREDYILYTEGYSMVMGNISFPHTVPEGKVFVMGDNRNNSTDSRFTSVGDIDKRLVVGHALCRVLPFSNRKSLLS